MVWWYSAFAKLCTLDGTLSKTPTCGKVSIPEFCGLGEIGIPFSHYLKSTLAPDRARIMDQTVKGTDRQVVNFSTLAASAAEPAPNLLPTSFWTIQGKPGLYAKYGLLEPGQLSDTYLTRALFGKFVKAIISSGDSSSLLL